MGENSKPPDNDFTSVTVGEIDTEGGTKSKKEVLADKMGLDLPDKYKGPGKDAVSQVEEKNVITDDDISATPDDTDEYKDDTMVDTGDNKIADEEQEKLDSTIKELENRVNNLSAGERAVLLDALPESDEGEDTEEAPNEEAKVGTPETIPEESGDMEEAPSFGEPVTQSENEEGQEEVWIGDDDKSADSANIQDTDTSQKGSNLTSAEESKVERPYAITFITNNGFRATSRFETLSVQESDGGSTMMVASNSHFDDMVGKVYPPSMDNENIDKEDKLFSVIIEHVDAEEVRKFDKVYRLPGPIVISEYDLEISLFGISE